jgi:hypothetical protein
LFPFGFIEEIYSAFNPEIAIWNAWENSFFREAVYLASPQLYDQIISHLQSVEKNKTNSYNLTITLLKYLTRISTRPTPFGLFGGMAMGLFSDNTEFTLNPPNQHKRKSRLDAGFMGLFSKNIVALNLLDNELLYYKNTSIYKIGEHLRYIETFFKEGQKEYVLQRTDAHDYLMDLFEYVSEGKKKKQIVSYLVEMDFPEDDARVYTNRLIKEQLLISEIESDCIGSQSSETLLKKLEKSTNTNEYDFLRLAKKITGQLDSWEHENITLYKRLTKESLSILPETKKNHLVQVDLFPSYKACNLNRQLKISLSRAMNVLYRITPNSKETKLDRFAKAYTNRYETQKIPLVKVLDIDSGISYPISNRNNLHPYISDLEINNGQNPKPPITLDEFSLFLLDKLQESKGNRLELTDQDLNAFEPKQHMLPITISAMAELIIEDGQQLLYLQEIGGSTANNLFGRFAYGSPQILDFVKEVNEIESSYYPNAMEAEIVHLPEERTGNILHRPRTRNHQINFLSGYNLKENGSIPIEDIIVEVKFGRVYLSDIKTDKRIVPYLSNAHNYIKSELPIYRFLCDIQFGSSTKGLGFSWANIEKLYGHLPRVTYKDIIISKEQWIFKATQIKNIFYGLRGKILIKTAMKFRQDNNLPRLVQLKDGDNLLLVDFESEIAIKMFLKSLAIIDSIVLIEFTGNKNKVVCDEQGNNYISEFVFSYARREVPDET